jgi:hypothetical protein
MGAGVQSSAANSAVHQFGYRDVSGVGLTVRLADSFSFGSGSSAYTPLHGLGTSNVLELDFVTGNGTRRTCYARGERRLALGA